MPGLYFYMTGNAMGKCQLCDSHTNGRLQDTLKYEEVYLKAYTNVRGAKRELGAYFRFYDTARPRLAAAPPPLIEEPAVAPARRRWPPDRPERPAGAWSAIPGTAAWPFV